MKVTAGSVERFGRKPDWYSNSNSDYDTLDKASAACRLFFFWQSRKNWDRHVIVYLLISASDLDLYKGVTFTTFAQHQFKKPFNLLKTRKNPQVPLCYWQRYGVAKARKIFSIWNKVHRMYPGLVGRNYKIHSTCILLDVLLWSIAEYFYELCHILTSPYVKI